MMWLLDGPGVGFNHNRSVVLLFLHLLAFTLSNATPISVQDCYDCCEALVDVFPTWVDADGETYPNTCSALCFFYEAACDAGCDGSGEVSACSLYQQQCDAGNDFIVNGFTQKGFALPGLETIRYCNPGGILSFTQSPTNSPAPPTPNPTNSPMPPSLAPTTSVPTPAQGDLLEEVLPVVIAGSAVAVLAFVLSGAVLFYRRSKKRQESLPETRIQSVNRMYDAQFVAVEDDEEVNGSKEVREWIADDDDGSTQIRESKTQVLDDDEMSDVRNQLNPYINVDMFERGKDEEETNDDDEIVPYIPQSVALTMLSTGNVSVYPSISGERYIAKFQFTAEQNDELTVAKGAKLEGIRQVNEDWHLVRNEYGVQGMVPVTFLEASALEDESIIPFDVED